MCYNYKALIRFGIKRSIHEKGAAEALAGLSEEEKKIWKERAGILAAMNEGTGEGGSSENVSEEGFQSSYPGAEVVVIPITTRQRESYYFGYLPNWATSFNDRRKNFNARSDSIRIKPTWKKAWFNNQRCLVCASGFYEDDRVNKKRYFFSVKGKEEIFFAGIFNHWKDPTTKQIFKTFAIVTTDPNELLISINHPRMPVILDEYSSEIYLNLNETEPVIFDLLKTYPAELMELREEPKPPRKKKGGTELNLDL